MQAWAAPDSCCIAHSGFTMLVRGAFATVVLLGARLASAVVVRDNFCALFRADGSLQFDAFGASTLAPSGVLHLVCTARVPPPGVPVVLGPDDFGGGGCLIERTITFTWRERISAAGQAVLECWRRPE
jgi:hypothetical protein